MTRQIVEKSQLNNTIKTTISEVRQTLEVTKKVEVQPKARIPSAQRPQPQMAYSLAKKRSPSPPMPHRSRSRTDDNPHVKGFKGPKNLLLHKRINSPIKDLKKKASPEKKDLTELAPGQRRFVIVE